MLTLANKAKAQADEVTIHVRLLDNFFYINTAAQAQAVKAATGMSNAPFDEWFQTLTSRDMEHAMNSPLYQAFKHCFPNKKVIVEDDGIFGTKVHVVDREIPREEAIAIVTELVNRVSGDYERQRDVQEKLNVLKSADPSTFIHWIRLARIAAVGDALDQIHASS